MALIDQYNLKSNAQFKARVSAAISVAANDIMNEDAGTTNHTERLVWAKASIKDPETVAEQMLWLVVQNPTIQTNGLSSSDNDIQFVVNSYVDFLAV